MIEVQNLTKSFGPTLAVDRISFSVARGEVLGFLGPNAAGKTTTMRILTGFMPADDGSASVAGYDVHEASLEVRRRIGYLPESAPLYDHMGVVEYLRYVARIRGLDLRDAGSRIRGMVDVCGLGSVLKKEIRELSKGYRQRVGLAATLIHDPEILVLDEPTTGLDPNQIIEIRQLIKEIGREKTIILSTHILPEVEATCGRVVIINQGRIVGTGTPQELAAQARGKAVYHVTLHADTEPASRLLASLPGVQNVTVVEHGDSRTRLRLESDSDAELGETVFRAAVEAGHSLSEIRRDAASLEQVFTSLTTGSAEER
jgi:ABC-2 type transport system ATP-binding protein